MGVARFGRTKDYAVIIRRLSCSSDYMDFVKDPISMIDYSKEEDPKVYKSRKTNRGPLDDDWVEKSVRDGTPMMCAYKLCRVEFRYWGMQSRIERFIHDYGNLLQLLFAAKLCNHD